MSEEFDAYGANKALVHNLVEHDTNAKSFFESFKNDIVEYLDTIETALMSPDTYFEAGNPKIIATTIILADPKLAITTDTTKQRHSILLIWDGAQNVYFYDPNGYYIFTGSSASDFSLGYILQVGIHDYQKIPSTKTMKKIISTHLTGKTIHIPVGKGIQYVYQTPEESKYINAGGYCMFYNWLVIKGFLEAGDWAKVYDEVINPRSKFWQATLPAATPPAIEEISKWIVEMVWVPSMKGGSKKRRIKKSRRRKRRRRRRRRSRRKRRSRRRRRKTRRGGNKSRL